MRILRQRRKQRLLDAGLLPFEAQTLSGTPLSHPAIKAIVKGRRQEYRQALRDDITVSQFRKRILDKYDEHNWKVTEGAKTRKGMIGMPDPWAMYRAWRQASIDSGDYVVPDTKKGRGKHGGRVLDVAQADALRRGKETGYLSRLSKREIQGY